MVYRGGDAISSQLEGVLIKFGVGVSLLVGAGLSFIWGALGLYLAKGYENKIKEIKDSSSPNKEESKNLNNKESKILRGKSL